MTTRMIGIVACAVVITMIGFVSINAFGSGRK